MTWDLDDCVRVQNCVFDPTLKEKRMYFVTCLKLE